MVSPTIDATVSVAETPSLAPLSNDAFNRLVRTCKLLSDETRLRILIELVARGELHVRALCDLLHQNQPSVSHHLAILREGGLIEARRRGKHNYYHALPTEFDELLRSLFARLPRDGRRVRFGDYVLSYSP